MRGLILVFTLAGVPQRPADGWLGADKAKHFVTAAFVQGLGYGSLRAAGVRHGVALAGATAGTVALSVGKELYDRDGRGTPSGKDLAWDAAGAGLSTVLLARTAR